MQQSQELEELRNAWSWRPAMTSALRNPFARSAEIKVNRAQAFQDIFVLSMLGGLEKGVFLEIGAHHPVENNNTFLLYECYGWRGVSIDIDPSYRKLWKELRPGSRLVIADALTIDYRRAISQWFDHDSLLAAAWRKYAPWSRVRSSGGKKRIDYLQLDIEPSANTLMVLKALPFDAYRFSVITFETDVYVGDTRAREESRAILSAQGYELIGEDVSVLYPPVSSEPIAFEDWWVDPQVVPPERIQRARRGLNPGKNSLPQKLLFEC